jgi:hypothetical protein
MKDKLWRKQHYPHRKNLVDNLTSVVASPPLPLTLFISIPNIKTEGQLQQECHHQRTVAKHFFLDSAQGTMGCGDTLKRCYA